MSRKSHVKSETPERGPYQHLVPAWMIAELQKDSPVQISLYAPIWEPLAPEAEMAEEDEDDWITL
ncbi:MAG: hypothetical protein JWN11_1950 [Hyphomicrobiales bacterium]|nr:hypothetical protein [Hyphomicrobiales bacterium]